jgi:hypothetical protein
MQSPRLDSESVWRVTLAVEAGNREVHSAERRQLDRELGELTPSKAVVSRGAHGGCFWET